MVEQCSVHSAHWGTLKFTVIFSKIHCTDPHTYMLPGQGWGLSWVEWPAKEAKERTGEVLLKGKKKKKSAVWPILGQRQKD